MSPSPRSRASDPCAASARDRPDRTPRGLGYRLPAEWEPHRSTWLAWPHERSDWPGRFAVIPWVYLEIVRVLAESEAVELIVPDARAERSVTARLRSVGVPTERVRFHRWPTDRSWVRDSGATFLVRPEPPAPVAALCWRFNAWAAYPNYRRDARVGERMARAAGVPYWVPRRGARRVVLEGGAFDSNGQGTLLATEQCLLDRERARNPGFERADYEAVFSDYAGIDRVLWLGRGIEGDDTHGHVDDLARFVGPRTVALAQAKDRLEPDFAALAENRERLLSATTAEGHAIEVLPLPMPRPRRYRGQRLPASYANFYVANRVVLVPTFNDPADREALAVLAGAFPDREVVGIHAADLVWGLGTLHCATQPEPVAGRPPTAAGGQAPHADRP